MILARVGNKITDLKQILPFVMRTWMYASGVMYPATSFEAHLSPFFATLAKANPLVVFIQIARQAFLPTVKPIMDTSTMWMLGTFWAIFIGCAGFIYFWLGEQEYGRG
jgi:teichoic acid transport system permease protein